MYIKDESDFLSKFYQLIDRTPGEINYTEYGSYIFSLFFIRYISCKSTVIYVDLLMDENQDVENIDIHASPTEFNVPPHASWDFIVKTANSNIITTIISNAMNTVEMMNKPFNKLTNDLKFNDKLINENYNIEEIIYYIDNEKTNKDYFWFKILNKIFNHLKVFAIYENYSNLGNIMEYLEQIYSTKYSKEMYFTA